MSSRPLPARPHLMKWMRIPGDHETVFLNGWTSHQWWLLNPPPHPTAHIASQRVPNARKHIMAFFGQMIGFAVTYKLPPLPPTSPTLDDSMTRWPDSMIRCWLAGRLADSSIFMAVHGFMDFIGSGWLGFALASGMLPLTKALLDSSWLLSSSIRWCIACLDWRLAGWLTGWHGFAWISRSEVYAFSPGKRLCSGVLPLKKALLDSSWLLSSIHRFIDSQSERALAGPKKDFGSLYGDLSWLLSSINY